MAPKFKVNDKIRITKYQSKVFSKTYTENWSRLSILCGKLILGQMKLKI